MYRRQLISKSKERTFSYSKKGERPLNYKFNVTPERVERRETYTYIKPFSQLKEELRAKSQARGRNASPYKPLLENPANLGFAPDPPHGEKPSMLQYVFANRRILDIK